MTTRLPALLATCVLAIAGCNARESGAPTPDAAADSPASPAVAGAPSTGRPADVAPPPAAVDPAPSEQPAGAMTMTPQAGWYSAGTFRPCGSAEAMRVDDTADLDARIRAGGMAAGEPVYVKLEGMAMGETYMLHGITQVGSPTPVRDCPMGGTTTQGG